MLRHYLKIAFRNLWKYRTQSIINVIGLSVSLACFALCFFWVRSIIGMDNDIPDVNRMYTVMEKGENYQVVYPLLGEYLMKEYPDIDKYTTIESLRKLIFEPDAQNPNRKYELNAVDVLPSFFEFFSFPFIGQALPDFKTRPNGVVLTESTAMKLYGKESAVGKYITTKRGHYTQEEGYREKDFTYTVCGIIKDLPGNSYLNLNFAGGKGIDILFINDELSNFNTNNEISSMGALTVVMLNPLTSMEQFNNKFANLSLKNIHRMFSNREENGYYILPFAKTMRESMGTMFYLILGVFGGLGMLVLLVSIFNYLSYSINLFLTKEHECAIRKSANAGKWHLFFLFFTEIAIVIVLAGLFAILWIALFDSYITSLFDNFYKVNMGDIYIQIFQYVALGLIPAFLLCTIPVNRINRKSVKDALFGGRSKNPKSGTRNILLGLQLFLSTVFISVSVFMYLQLNYISTLTLETLTDEEKKNTYEIKIEHEMLKPYLNNIVLKLKENPYIEDIFLSRSELATRSTTMTSFRYNDKEIDWKGISYMDIGHNYFDFIHLPIIEGRIWEEDESNAIIISKKAKEMLDDQNPVGKTINNYRTAYTIVGVVEDILSRRSSEETRATFYTQTKNDEYRLVYVKINPVKRKECLEYINKTIREYMPETLEFKLNSVSENISKINELENIMLKLVVLFAVVSVIVSLFGVYAIVTLTTKRRQKEVAIRKINGATLTTIVRLFLRTYMKILLIAVIPAFAIIYFGINKWLETYAYHISVSWFVFAFILIGLVALLILTIIYQLIKVARINPVEVIKSE